MQIVIALIALAGSTASANIPEKPQWQSSYYEARAWAAERSKPLAVFLGSGLAGWEQMTKNGYDAKHYQLLKAKYVCVFVNTDSAEGKKLAAAFEIPDKGVVISDRTGKSQAFHHSGEISKELLAKALERYADRDVASTESIASLVPTPSASSSAQPVIRFQSRSYST